VQQLAQRAGVGVVVSIAAKIICVQIGCGGSADGKED
jgi:hypothetical protein